MADASDPSPTWRPATLAVASGRPPRGADVPLNTPITMASAYHAGGDTEYARYGNPTWTAFETALGALEGGRCLAFSSGMAAISTLLDLTTTGATVVAPRNSYSGTILALADREARGRVRAHLVDITDTAATIAACADAALVIMESPTNPALEVADLEAITAAAHDAGAYVVVDNTFATPIYQRPLELGVDVVVHSATKYIAGHSDLVLGAVVTRDDELYGVLKGRRDLDGTIPGPMETWLALRGLRTMPLRVERASHNAAEIARRAQSLERVEVRYPGFGAVVALVLPDADTADVMVRATTLWTHATSLGGVESTLERRRRWNAESPHIPEGLVRLSVGIEDVDDLWTDLAAALAAAGIA